MKVGRWVTCKIGEDGAVFAALRRAKGWRIEDGFTDSTTVLVLPNFLVPRSDPDFSGSEAAPSLFNSANRPAIFSFDVGRSMLDVRCFPIRSARRATACLTMSETCATW